MITITEVADAPWVEIINGVSRTFKLWPTQELIPILTRIRATRVESLKRWLDSCKVVPREAAYMLAKEETANLDPHDAYQYLTSAQGVDECLIKSLVWGGLPEAEAKEVVVGLRFTVKETLAIRASNIYELRLPPSPAAATTPGKKEDGTGFGDAQKAPEQPAGFGDSKPLP